MKSLSRRWIGIIEILLSGFCFGFLGYFGKHALANGVGAGELLALRYSLAALMMMVFLVLRARSMRVLMIGRSKILASLFLGVLGYAVFSSFYFFALERISASMTVILLYMYPVLVAAGGAIFFGDRIPRERLPAIPIAFFGLVLLVWADMGVGNPMGLVFGLLSAVFYSVYILLSSHWLKGVDALVSTFWIQLGAGLPLFAVHYNAATVFQRIDFAFTHASLSILGLAFICSVLAMTLFMSGLLKVKSWEASLLSMAEPITGVLVGVLLLGESLRPSQWVGAVLVLLALAIVSGLKFRKS